VSAAIYYDLHRQMHATSRGASLVVALRTLAPLADHAGRVRITIADLARRMGCVGERQTQRLLGHLVAAGVIEREATFTVGGAQLANTYRLLTSWVRHQIEHEQTNLANHAVQLAQGVQREAVKWLTRKVYRLKDGREGCTHATPPCDECRRQ
jgi:hypothetical protein